MLNETKYKPLLLNYTQWENGQTGSVGMFGQNGDGNKRVLGTDPWGKETVLWEVSEQDASSDADGGWNASYVNVDPDYYYRFSTWIRRPVVGSGSTYFGCHGSPAVLNLSNGASNTNPYFWSGGFSHRDWVLIVGHIHPQGTVAGSPMHPDSGFYSVEQGRFGNISIDFIFANGTTSARHRSYLYYSTDTSTVQQWVYPRMDKCDGTEPTIADLLAGHDSRNEDFVRSLNGTEKKPLAVQDKETKISNVSECSITNGLVAWYPLQGDAKELVDRKDGVVTGAVPDARGYLFDGSNDRVTSSVPLLGNGNPHSFCFWFKLNSAISSRVDPFTMGNAATNQYSSIDVNSTSINWYFYSNDTTASFTPAVGQWYFLAASYAGGAANNTNKKLYINAQPLSLSAGSSTVSALPDNPNLGIGYDRGRSTAYFPGNIADVRIYNRALSAEEIDILYNTTNPESETKMKLTEDCIYLQGQLKEV
jgi:hypothetical protein